MTDPTKKTPAALAGAAGAAKYSIHEHRQSTDISCCLEAFRAFIAANYGLELIGEFRGDGVFHGIRASEDRHGGRPFRYCVHLDPPQNVYFIDLKRGFSGVWFPEGQGPLSPAEREQLRREAEARRLRREREILAWQQNAAARARALWNRARKATADHPYLVRKNVGAYGLRLLPVWERRIEPEPGRFERLRVENVLLVPMRDDVGDLWNVQAIFPEPCPALEGRDKDFLPGTRKKGLLHWVGERTDLVCLAEGFATAATIHEATGYRAVVCFDCGNLPIVAETVRGLLPEARIVVCADHDRAGLNKAIEAAELVDGLMAVPPVPGQDFNDWANSLKGADHGG